MKIAIIGHKRIPSNEGGIEKGVEQHAVRMVKRGHSVTAYNRGGHNVFGKEFDREKQKEYKGIRIVTIENVLKCFQLSHRTDARGLSALESQDDMKTVDQLIAQERKKAFEFLNRALS